MNTAIGITLLALTLLPAAALARHSGAPVIELRAVDADQPLRVASAGPLAYGCLDGIGCSGERSYKLALKAAIKGDPDYSAARGKLIAGIVVLSAGGIAAGVMGLIALINATLGRMDTWDEQTNQPRPPDGSARSFGIAALCSLGVALAVGLPLLISGASDRAEIRRRAQRRLAAGAVELASGPGQAGLALRYRF